MQAKNKTHWLWSLIKISLFGINLIVLILLLSSYLAWNISPSKTTFFSYIGLGFPFILIANILFLVFWISILKWKYAIISFAILLICSKPIFTYIPISLRSKEVPATDKIKILSYNVRGFNWKIAENNQKNPIFTYIRESGADIVCIQEYISSKNPKMGDDDAIKEILKYYPYSAIVNLRPAISNYTYGLACYSKYPILSTEKIPISSSTNGSVGYLIKIKNKSITLINNHLESNRITNADKQLYRELFKEKDTYTLDNVAHNIKSRLGIAYVKRSLQADEISAWINNQQTDGVIVCGDFNDTPISYTYGKIKGNLLDAFTETGTGLGITYHENKFWFRIDYIMHSKHIKSYNCTVDQVKYSDHYPIWTYLEL